MGVWWRIAIPAFVCIFVVGADLQDFKRDDDGTLLYAYYRNTNYDQGTPIPTYCPDGSNETVIARAVSWDYSTYRIFDSIDDVYVARYDVSFRENQSAVNLGAYEDACVRVGPGGAYFFTTSRMVTIEDVLGGESVNFDFLNLATVAGGACVKVTIEPDPERYNNGNSSLFVVSAGGNFDPTPACAATLTDVKKAHFRSGTDMLHNNAVRYVADGTCANPILGGPGAEDYDNLDGPDIPPLASHYHTRGSLYFSVNGSTGFDEGVAPLTRGELRYVAPGYFYGPEVLEPAESFLIALHEPDPNWIVYDDEDAGHETHAPSTAPVLSLRGAAASDDDYSPCPIACLDLPNETSVPMRCYYPGRA